jgi:hypothetical protein
MTTRRLSFRARVITELPVSLRILLAILFSRVLLSVIDLLFAVVVTLVVATRAILVHFPS